MLPNLLIFGLLRRPINEADSIHRGYIKFYWRQCRTIRARLYVLKALLLSLPSIGKDIKPWLKKNGRKTAALGFKSTFRQKAEMYYLTFLYSIDAENYYLQEFYRIDGLKRARQFVNKGAIKQGVYNLLRDYSQQVNKMQESCSLGKKVEFTDYCQKKDIPVVPVLMEINPDKSKNLEHSNLNNNLLLPQKNLFCKPNQDNEGEGAEVWFWQGDNSYKSQSGVQLSAVDLYKRLHNYAKKHFSKSILVQPLVLPHKKLSIFRKQATPTIRVISYIDPNTGDIIPDCAMLRFSWQEDSVVDNASAGGIVAPIDINKGVLGSATGSGEEFITKRWNYLPDTNTKINGFLLPYWPDTIKLVIHAHNYFKQRLVVGWDIMITDDGPVILEGNSQPGLCYMQKAHLKPLGETSLGVAIAYYVKKAENYLYSGAFKEGFTGDIEDIDFYKGSNFKRLLSTYLIKNKQAVYLIITGKVQGVFYRKWLKKQAGKRRLNGWVRNLDDGRVEAVIKGRAVDVEDLIRLCRVGPDNAIVDNIEIYHYKNNVKGSFEIIG